MRTILIIMFFVLVGCSVAQDSLVTIGQLPAAVTLSDTDKLEIEQSDSNRHLTWLMLKDSLVQNTGTETISGNKTFSGSNTFNGVNSFNNGVIMNDGLTVNDALVVDTVWVTQIRPTLGTGNINFVGGSANFNGQANFYGNAFFDSGVFFDNDAAAPPYFRPPTFFPPYTNVTQIGLGVKSTNLRLLWYNGTSFDSLAYLSDMVLNINELSDVSISSQTTWQFLGYTGSNWSNLNIEDAIQVGTLKLSQIPNQDTIYSPVMGGIIDFGATSITDTEGILRLPFVPSGQISNSSYNRQLFIHQLTGTLQYRDLNNTVRTLLEKNPSSGSQTVDSTTIFKDIGYYHTTKTSGTTIDATNKSLIELDYNNIVIITAITGGYTGQTIKIYNGTSFTATFQDGTNLQMPNDTNLSLGGYGFVEMLCVDGTVWICAGASDN